MNLPASIDALRLAVLGWLSWLTKARPSRLGGPAAFAQRDGSARNDCGPGLLAPNVEAGVIMRGALGGGASRLELARAAVAAARAVLPLIPLFKPEATAVVLAAEAWVSSPNNENADAVWRAKQALSAACGKLACRDITSGRDSALTAVEAAAMACCAPFGASMLAVLAVECAANAAGGEIDIAPQVTAALL